jgi:hypothetical protein
MADKEARELLETARRLLDEANKSGFEFINSELTFAKRAWSLGATGHWAAAKVQKIAAITAYETAKKFLPNLGIPVKERELLKSKLGTVGPLIEQLATIT